MKTAHIISLILLIPSIGAVWLIWTAMTPAPGSITDFWFSGDTSEDQAWYQRYEREVRAALALAKKTETSEVPPTATRKGVFEIRVKGGVDSQIEVFDDLSRYYFRKDSKLLKADKPEPKY